MPDEESQSFAVSNDVKVVSLEEEMKGSYLDYAMSVIVSRALPDVRDGLKPVHRRILFAMNEAGYDYNRATVKSAKVVGEVLGKYHPHGDTATYEAMARLAQDFNMGIPLIHGQGNFGSMDGDPPAAQRYTEAKLARISRELLDDIDSDTVDFQPNYDDSLEEPTVLPARFPNLLVNGANGIAVGMATYIPTHNLGEIVDACCALIQNPELSTEELVQIIPGPDFPTGGTVLGRGGLMQAYRTGRGSALIRSKSHIEESHSGRESIVITEIPFQVNKARMVERIAELVREKVITDISNIRDESDRHGVRIVLDLKKDAVSDVVLNQLYRFSPVQVGLNFNMLALVYGRPEQLSLKKILEVFLMFREDVVRRRTRYELGKARERTHVLMGFATALANLDDVISLIRRAADRPTAKRELLERQWKIEGVLPLLSLVDDANDPDQGYYKLSETQADAILDLRLHRLTGLEQEKIHNELGDLAEVIRECIETLSSRARVLDIIRHELLDVKTKYATPRRTVIADSQGDVDDADLIQREDMVVTVSLEGYIKRVPLGTYRSQRRGGKGRSGMATKEEDVVSDVFVANTHSDILFFSTRGQVYSLKTYQLPQGGPQSKGRAIVNLFPLEENEKISTVLVIPDGADRQGKYLIFMTSIGNVRRNVLADFDRIMSKGKKAIRMDEGESLIGVRMATEDDDIFVSTAKGMANRFPVTSVRVFAGRDSNGVRAIRLDEGDFVTNVSILRSQNVSPEERVAYKKAISTTEDVSEVEGLEEGQEAPTNLKLSDERLRELSEGEQFILTITERGFGKRSSSYEYRTTNRGTKGVSNIQMVPRNGDVVASFPVSSKDDIILVTDSGQLIRCPVGDIRVTRRMAQGVIVFRVNEGEKVVGVSLIPHTGEEESEAEETLPADAEEAIKAKSPAEATPEV